MSGDGKRSVGHRPQATAPVLDSTTREDSYLEAYVSAAGGAADASETGGDVIDTSARDPVRKSIVRCEMSITGGLSTWESLGMRCYEADRSKIGDRSTRWRVGGNRARADGASRRQGGP
jgi:hypothetical protein